jgi:hypothetical protein
MDFKGALKGARLEYRNFAGKGFDEKYVVIESDDWGSIRQPSRAVYDAQIKRGGHPERDPFTHYDSLEKDEDLEPLFEVLSRHYDAHGRPAVITANYAVANPDFDKIENCGFAQYHYESVDETLRGDPGCSRMRALWKQGMDGGVWAPQLHCREHVQIEKWMESLRRGDEETTWAFSNRMISTADMIAAGNPYAYMDAFNHSSAEEARDQIERIVSDATAIFTRLFGFASKTFVAPCYVWGEALESALRKSGIDALQGGWYQWVPLNGSLRKKVHYNGEIQNGRLYMVRNCLFEHSLFGGEDAVASCLNQMESAFRWRRPAVISSHRVNYMGRIEEANRARGLRLLDELLAKMRRRWPDIVFISSSGLADLYRENDGVHFEAGTR